MDYCSSGSLLKSDVVAKDGDVCLAVEYVMVAKCSCHVAVPVVASFNEDTECEGVSGGMHGYELDRSSNSINIEKDPIVEVVDEVIDEAVVEPDIVDALLVVLSTDCGTVRSCKGRASCQVESDEEVDKDLPVVACADVIAQHLPVPIPMVPKVDILESLGRRVQLPVC